MPRTFVPVGKLEMIEVLYRIARNERVSAGRRVASIDLIARLKGYSGFKKKDRKSPTKKSAQAEPVQDLLGLKHEV